ncbi:hypothetical protein HL658_35875 [Azospirillum sp. RWY-5-1]|uniref:Oxaloacetate decarboxylase, gamma chain n=1 Tax=Azospirillum oleiclasticum TaxID=2735135 RepID=A0ABX2TN39_9PROT|nr:OadG family transporter subunit [Azospirillum oleiclasticum]NYZ17949.1 hypothetical protein [Azospirillum oleiclasticum]NYZ25133.1 hypothetical protein [Azospirillum oleiclasticum]
MQHILLIVGGLTVVIGVLALLWGATALVGRLFAGAPPPMVPAAPSPAKPAVPPHHLAAIAAAVAVMTGGRGRVVRVTALPHRAEGWTQHARAGHAAGHRVRWDWAVPGPPHIDHAPSAREGQS